MRIFYSLIFKMQASTATTSGLLSDKWAVSHCCRVLWSCQHFLASAPVSPSSHFQFLSLSVACACVWREWLLLLLNQPAHLSLILWLKLLHLYPLFVLSGCSVSKVVQTLQCARTRTRCAPKQSGSFVSFVSCASGQFICLYASCPALRAN